MKSSGKDSPEVVKFMELFARLKYLSDDEPDNLIEDAANDSNVSELCVQLSFAAGLLTMNEHKAHIFCRPG
jgi:hypothetical protein